MLIVKCYRDILQLFILDHSYSYLLLVFRFNSIIKHQKVLQLNELLLEIGYIIFVSIIDVIPPPTIHILLVDEYSNECIYTRWFYVFCFHRRPDC